MPRERAQRARHLREVLIERAGSTRQRAPGYTHLQRAQPCGSHNHWIAFEEALARDTERFTDLRQRLKLARSAPGTRGSTLPPTVRPRRPRSASRGEPQQHGRGCVARCRVEFLADGAICMVNLSRLAEELVLWSSAEFASSARDAYARAELMPQKKNPDVPSCARQDGRATAIWSHC